MLIKYYCDIAFISLEIWLSLKFATTAKNATLVNYFTIPFITPPDIFEIKM